MKMEGAFSSKKQTLIHIDFAFCLHSNLCSSQPISHSLRQAEQACRIGKTRWNRSHI